MKVFLNTNIILDFLSERKEFYLPSAKLISLAYKKKFKIYLSPNSISTTFYLLSKETNSKIALEKIRNLKIICHTSIIDDDVVEKAIHSGFKDFEDALKYFNALASECNIIISRNGKDFRNA